jgi:uncharacterized membrane protein YgcG
MALFPRTLGFRAREDGNATIEFVILFPMFIFLFLTGFEAGYYMVRNVMLERAVDVAVRDVRLSNGQIPGFVKLKENICVNAGIIPDCVNSLQIELVEIAAGPGGVNAVNGPVRCVDKDSTDDPLSGTNFDIGGQNRLMMIRVCALSQPLFPTTRLGVGMKADNQGNYAIVATTAFVNEPGQRTIAAGTDGSGDGGAGGAGGGIGTGTGDGASGTGGNT